MPTKEPETVAATIRTLEELLDEGYRLHEVTSTEDRLVLTLFKAECGLKLHLDRAEVQRLLTSPLLDQLAQTASKPDSRREPALA